jgi:aspartate/methionine/tyrosine aminotransferase
MDSVTFTVKFSKEQAVVVVSGRKFRDEEDSHVRINLVCEKKLEKTINQYIDEYKNINFGC